MKKRPIQPDEDLSTLGLRLSAKRREKGLTQNALADLVDKGVTTVRYYEYDIVIPTVSSIAKIAKILDVSLDWLITGKEWDGPRHQAAEQETSHEH